MSTHLDLDDVAATSPLAMKELATLRVEIKFFEAAKAFAAAHAERDYYERADPSEEWIKQAKAADDAYNATKAALMDAYRDLRPNAGLQGRTREAGESLCKPLLGKGENNA